jgi:hypothetical protein
MNPHSHLFRQDSPNSLIRCTICGFALCWVCRKPLSLHGSEKRAKVWVEVNSPPSRQGFAVSTWDLRDSVPLLNIGRKCDLTPSKVYRQ